MRRPVDVGVDVFASAALRRLNINLSAEVAGFQLERRDSRETYTREKKLLPREKCKKFVRARVFET